MFRTTVAFLAVALCQGGEEVFATAGGATGRQAGESIDPKLGQSKTALACGL